MRHLLILDGDRTERQIPLTQDRYTLGRGPDNDIVLDVKKVSRQHAILVSDGDSHTIIDQDSVNHIYVNGEQVRRRRLAPGDTIHLSRNLAMRYEDTAEESDALTPSMVRLARLFGKEGFQRLQDVTNRIISLDSLENILNVILQTVIRLVCADRGFIALIDENGEIVRDNAVSYRIPLDSETTRRTVFCHSIVHQVIHTGKSIFILSTVDEVERVTTSIEELRLRSVMCAPLLFGDKLVGILYVDSGSKLANFTETDQLLFGMLANHAAIAIENAKRYSQIQRSVVELKTEIEQSQERYRQLVELLPDAILVHANNRLLFVNQAAVRLLRAENRQVLLDRPLLDQIHPDDRSLVAERMNQLAEVTFSSPRLAMRLLRQDGTSVDVEAMYTAMVFEGIPAIVILARDITERKKVEEIFTRTEKLESIGLLAGGIAHDFNNLLSVILGNISLAKLSATQEGELLQILSDAEDASRRAKELTHQLLTFSRGGTPLKMAGSISDVLKETTGFALRGSGISGDFTRIRECPTIQFDESQVSQVINNLIINAVQAMPAGGRVELGCEPVYLDKGSGLPLRPGNYIRISVGDHGVGIPQADIPRIFDPYFTTKQMGSGLGLAIAHSIMARHDGCIDVDSKCGAGTTFYLYLPATEVGDTPRELTDLQVLQGAGHILFMDDEETVRSCGARMLKSLGYEVTLVSDGNEAIREYGDAYKVGTPHDAVIMDLTVPGGMGGREAICQLLAIDPGIKAIVSSGYSNDPVMGDYGAHGFKGVLPKPYNLQELAVCVQKVLERATPLEGREGD